MSTIESIVKWFNGDKKPVQPEEKKKPSSLMELVGKHLPEGAERSALQKVSDRFGERFCLIEGKIEASKIFNS